MTPEAQADALVPVTVRRLAGRAVDRTANWKGGGSTPGGLALSVTSCGSIASVVATPENVRLNLLGGFDLGIGCESKRPILPLTA
jgi:hypothetical protein